MGPAKGLDDAQTLPGASLSDSNLTPAVLEQSGIYIENHMLNE
uniref:Pentapeptide repeat-containing protein n=1 Tax=Melanopsichium pennsylvanicum 4 TaxID=1398559 RepID=A0A077RCJ2_9BASI|nr:uncharacterized protein BN887_06276 [Melanopsichium pennsylvanicum 4]